MTLPIEAVLPEVVAALREAPAVVLVAPTGAGKTTRVPPALTDAGFGRVVMLEPRRLAARAAARRIADERGVRVGGEVGWHVRFDRKAGPDTRILVVTEGILVRMLQDNPFLEGFGVVVIDEFHERSLHADLSLAMVRRVQAARADLRLVVMSATLDAEPLAAWLGAPIVRSVGRAFPVDVHYLPHPADPLEAGAVEARRLFASTAGDVLVFLPGIREIRQMADSLPGLPLARLYGDLPPAEQDVVLQPGSRKIVLATNVAETSVTLPGVTAVVDTGLVRILRRDAATGLDRLELGRISQASADQRAGRAGRTSPGVCQRLWTRREHAALAEREDPEVRRVDLAGPVLQLLAWGERDVEAFPWFEPPPAETVAAARELLERLGAVEGGMVTAIGKTLARLPVHPRLGRLLLEANRLGWRDRGALLAAILAERDFVRGEARHSTFSDALDRVDAVESGKADREILGFVLRARDQLKAIDLPPPGRAIDADEALLRAVLAGFPDRVARRRGDRRGVLVGGRGVRLDARSGVDADLFVCVDVDAGERGRHSEGVVRLASGIREEWLAVRTDVEAGFDATTERVVAMRRKRYLDLVLDESPAALPAASEVARALAESVSDLDRVLSEEGREWLVRARCLAAWMPELGLPAPDPVAREVLPELCVGRRSHSELRRAPWREAMESRLPWKQREALDREAPERIGVPSGSRIRVEYAEGRAPLLAVRIQELFGLRETPRIAGGRVRVVLHLLAPNQRPQQVTDDLASFWANTWPEVRKELRARYPKHSWPEDPLNAAPEAKPRRKR